MSVKFCGYEYGGERQTQYLLDVFTSCKYRNQFPFEEDDRDAPRTGSLIWKSESEIDPMETFVAAVTAQACLMWIKAYESGDAARIYEEERFFHQNDLTERVLDELKYLVSVTPRWRWRGLVRAIY